MAYDPVKNFCKVIVNGLYNNTATTIQLALGEGNKLPNPSTEGQYNLVWWNATDYSDPSDDPYKEIVRVTAKSGDQITILRGQEGTTAQNHNLPGKTYKMMLALTKKTYEDLQTIEVYKDGTLVGQRAGLNFLNFNDISDDTTNQRINLNLGSFMQYNFGDGSDGDLIISTGTTTINLGGNKVFIKKYRNLKITGNANLTFINPHNDGTLIVFLVKEDCELTSNASNTIDLRNLGGLGDTDNSGGRGWFQTGGGRVQVSKASSGGSASGSDAVGAQNGIGGCSSVNNSQFPRGHWSIDFFQVGGGSYFSRWLLAISPSFAPFFANNNFVPRDFLPIPGGGGSKGSIKYGTTSSGVDPSPGTPGSGGRGGGGLLILVGGNLTVSSSFTINASGSNGSAGTGGAGNGGGGAGGSVLIAYRGTKTGSDITFNVAGGNDGGGGTTYKGADGIGLIVPITAIIGL
jgi:hypothetical protein